MCSLLFADTEQAEGGSQGEEGYSLPGVRGTQGAGDGLSGYSCKLASGPCGCWGPQSQ